MKDLFKKKKGDGQQASDKPAKKPLFAKKPTKANQAHKPAKKPAFSFSKKKPATADKPKNISSKKVANGKKTPNLDLKKIMMGLVALLIVVLLALMAKLFIFSDDSTSEPMPVQADPMTEEAVPQTDSGEEGTSTQDQNTQADVSEAENQEEQPSENDISADVVVEPEIPQSQEVNPAPAAEQKQTKQAEQTTEKPIKTTNKPTTTDRITYEDFLRESSQKIHRERSTSQ